MQHIKIKNQPIFNMQEVKLKCREKAKEHCIKHSSMYLLYIWNVIHIYAFVYVIIIAIIELQGSKYANECKSLFNSHNPVYPHSTAEKTETEITISTRWDLNSWHSDSWIPLIYAEKENWRKYSIENDYPERKQRGELVNFYTYFYTVWIFYKMYSSCIYLCIFKGGKKFGEELTFVLLCK